MNKKALDLRNSCLIDGHLTICMSNFSMTNRFGVEEYQNLSLIKSLKLQLYQFQNIFVLAQFPFIDKPKLSIHE